MYKKSRREENKDMQARVKSRVVSFHVCVYDSNRCSLSMQSSNQGSNPFFSGYFTMSKGVAMRLMTHDNLLCFEIFF